MLLPSVYPVKSMSVSSYCKLTKSPKLCLTLGSKQSEAFSTTPRNWELAPVAIGSSSSYLPLIPVPVHEAIRKDNAISLHARRCCCVQSRRLGRVGLSKSHQLPFMMQGLLVFGATTTTEARGIGGGKNTLLEKDCTHGQNPTLHLT